LAITSGIFREEGICAFYKGLSAALLRQVLYTGARLGFFDEFTRMARSPGEKQLAFWKTALCASSAGGLAAVVGNPADLALVRMQADALLPPSEKRGYKHIGDALTSIVKNEGYVGLLSGVVPTAVRAMAQNFGMLAFNLKAKEQLEHWNFATDNVRVLTAAAIAGFAASVFALPFDYVKTQIQKMTPDPETGKMPYKGPLDCALKQLRERGPLTFYAGFPVFYVRIAPHAMIALVMQDQLKKVWKSCGI